MKKEDFKFGDIMYEAVFDGILVKIHEDTLDEKTVEYASIMLKAYFDRKSEIIDYILDNGVLDFYEGSYTIDEIIKRLKEPELEIISDNWGVLTWLNHELDEHIIGVEFGNDMKLSYVSIDG